MESRSLTSAHERLRITPSAPRLQTGLCIDDKYIVLGPLGQGGCAVVYAAEHAGLARPVAIKVLHVTADTPADWVDRFRREARLAALVRHPNVLEVHDTGTLPDGSPYLVMEPITGPNLADLPLPLPLERALELALGLLAGLAAIADAGIVHRDIKPGNLMLHTPVSAAPVLKIVDFGIAKRASKSWDGTLTNHGSLVGTPRYMAPEQVRGEQADASTDVYAAGAVLYEILTGSAPFESQSLGEQVSAVLHTVPTAVRCLRSDCPVELEQIVMRALARERHDRYPTPHALLAELRAWQRSALRSDAGPPRLDECDPEESLLEHSLRSLQRTRLGWLAVALVVASVLVSAPWWQRPRATPAVRASLTPRAPSAQPDLHTRSEPPSRPALLSAVSADARPVADGSASVRRPVPREEPRLAAKPAARVARPEPLAQPASTTPPALPSAAFARAMQSALGALATGRTREAEALYAEATRIAPNEATAFRGHGLALARLGEHTQARAALERYLSLAPQAEDAQRIAARIAELPSASAP